MTIMIGLALATITYVRAYTSFPDTGSGWRSPLFANHSSCAGGNERALYCATSIDCFELGCGNGGPVGRAP